MLLLKITPVLLFVILVGAEKKIELQDIEDDNLKSEKENDSDDQPEARSQSEEPGPSLPLEFFKNGFLRYFEAPSQPQQHRYVQQYAVTEPPERAPVTPKPQYGPPAPQQAMVGYLSNVPMQIYLVPQYYTEPSEQVGPQQGGQYQTATIARVAGYQSSPEHVQSHANYVQMPAYVTPPERKTYIPQYTQPVAYISYQTQPTIAPVQATVAPVLTYQLPVVQYPTAIVPPPPKAYYQNAQYQEPNPIEDIQENEIDNQKNYETQSEPPYVKPAPPEYPRYYNSRAPIRDDYRSGPSELPHPSPLLLKPPPPHLSHLPKALPIYRPLIKPVYGTPNIIPTPLTPRPTEAFGPTFKRRPNSLLDSYIPSSVQVEFLKRGYAKDPLSLYEALSSGRPHPSAPVVPRQYERGFLPNQMYHTGAGGITYGHFKRSSKGDKVPQK